MSERKLLFLMTAEQADVFARLGEPVTADTEVEPSRVQFIEAEAGQVPKFIGLINIHPNGLGDEAQIGRQAEQVVKIEQEAESRHAATKQAFVAEVAASGVQRVGAMGDRGGGGDRPAVRRS